MTGMKSGAIPRKSVYVCGKMSSSEKNENVILEVVREIFRENFLLTSKLDTEIFLTALL